MRVAGYMRLSRDEDKESYSSILSQKSMIDEYAAQQNWDICKYYIDDNCTGYSFDRPGFNELLEDIENDRIDVIIAKDLSRIGRHNAYTLLFLDKVKHLNKRLILPREGKGYDTAADESDLLGITTWYNEMYVKDISRKIRSSIKIRQREGRMIIKEAFGYRRSSEDKHKLELDLEAAAIVKRVFILYLEGYGYRKVAEILNQEGYPTPSLYNLYKLNSKKNQAKTTAAWSSVHVQRILKNDIYTGILRLGKTEKNSIKGKSQKQPIALQYVFENNHPAIISREQFDKVQNIAEQRKLNHSKGAASMQNLFSGLLYCKSCSSYMISYKKQGKPNCYICGSYHKYGKKVCNRHTVREDFLLKSIKELMRLLLDNYIGERDITQLNTKKDNFIDHGILKNKLVKERQKCKGQLKQIILRRITEVEKENRQEYQNIMKDSLDELEEELKGRLLYLENSLQLLQQEVQNEPGKTNIDKMQLINNLINGEINKKHLELLVDKILIDSDGTPTIYIKTDLGAICNHIREDMNTY